MREVHAAAANAHLEQFAKAVSLPGDLWDGLPWTESELRGHRGRLDWDPYAEWLDRLGTACGSDDQIRAVGGTMDEAGQWVGVLMQSVVSAQQMIRVWERLIPHFWRCMSLRVTQAGDQAEIRVELAPGYRGCRTMFCASGAAIASTPVRIGLPRLQIVHEEFSARHGVWRYAMPPSRTLPARVRARWDGLFAALAADSYELDEAVARIHAVRSDVDDYVRTVRRVVDLGRDAVVAADFAALGGVAGRAVVEACGYAGFRLTTAGGDSSQRGTRDGVATALPVRSDDADLALLEAWGTPRHPDLLTTLVPWLVLGLKRLAAADAERERMDRADRERGALSALSASRPTWIVGRQGVEWANDAGRGELEADPDLSTRLRTQVGPDADFDVSQVSGGARLIQRRGADAEHRRTAVERWGLTPAQARVLEPVVRGLSNKEVAGELGVEEKTVEAHLGQIFRRSGATNRASLLYAFWHLSQGNR